MRIRHEAVVLGLVAFSTLAPIHVAAQPSTPMFPKPIPPGPTPTVAPLTPSARLVPAQAPTPKVVSPQVSAKSSLAFTNADFEADTLTGWNAGGAVRRCGQERSVVTPHPNAPASLPVGGNYWKVPAEVVRSIGAEGSCWLNVPKGSTSISPTFTPAGQRWMRALARTPAGGRDASSPTLPNVGPSTTPSIELQTAAGVTLLRNDVPGAEVMQQVLFDLEQLPAQQRTIAMRIVITTPVAATGPTDVDAVGLFIQKPTFTPTTQATVPLWGFADSHAHPMAHLAHDGKWLVGGLDGPMSSALSSCPGLHGAPALVGGQINKRVAIDSTEYAPARGLGEGHNDRGFPTFEGWPLATTILHQQMYVDWIRRAWEGGLRLMVAHVGSYDLFLRLANGVFTHDDASLTRTLIGQLKAFVARHPDFMEVALSPADARRIIKNGKLAIVMGSEMDSFGGCKGNKGCTRADLLKEVRELYTLGIRHFVPIGHANNALGGAALYNSDFNLNSWYLNGRYFVPASNFIQPPNDKISFTLGTAGWDRAFMGGVSPLGVTNWKASSSPTPATSNVFAPPAQLYGSVPVHVNEDGLYDHGKAVIEEMLRVGMIVDVDHMSYRATQDSLAIARRRNQPVVAGHMGFRSLGYMASETDDPHKLGSEGSKSDADATAIAELGGFLGPITHQADTKPSPFSHVSSTCQNSSRSWLQEYLHAVKLMNGRGVGLGTDFNGFAGQPGPRFGPFACLGRNKGLGYAEADPMRWFDAATGRRSTSARAATRLDANDQTLGVIYNSPTRSNFYQRFAADSTTMPYDIDEIFFWEALATVKAGKGWADVSGRLGAKALDPTNNLYRVQNFVKGLAATAVEADFFGNHFVTERNAAFLAKGTGPIPTNLSPAATIPMANKLRSVSARWDAMSKDSPNTGAPIVRSVAGQRDFDINLDGLAHYGLLPDFLQDVHNQLAALNPGRTGAVRDLRVLFRSAEDYIQTWEKVEAGRGH